MFKFVNGNYNRQQILRYQAIQKYLFHALEIYKRVANNLTKPMKEDQPVLFFKFGSEENMTDLLKNGTIYFNTIDYFQRLEEQGLRGDNYEGTTKITNYNQHDNLKVTIEISETGKKIPLNPTKFHLREFLNNIRGNLYSMYCLRPKDIIGIDVFKIDKQVKKFGTHFVLIKNVGKFITQVYNELESKKINFQAKQVEYYEKDKINDEISLFQKVKDFEYQNEFRIVLYNDDIEPKIIRIGSIEDYAEIFPISALDILEIKWNTKKTTGNK